MDRKYKQRGYQDNGQEQKPRPAPQKNDMRAPKMPAFREVTRCNLCGQMINIEVGGITVDRHGHVWVIHRPRSLTDDEKGATLTPPRSKCCASAPPILEFDTDGNLLRSWGGVGEGSHARQRRGLGRRDLARSEAKLSVDRRRRK